MEKSAGFISGPLCSTIEAELDKGKCGGKKLLLLLEIKSSFDDNAFRFTLRGIVSSYIFLDHVTIKRYIFSDRIFFLPLLTLFRSMLRKSRVAFEDF